MKKLQPISGTILRVPKTERYTYTTKIGPYQEVLLSAERFLNSIKPNEDVKITVVIEFPVTP